MYKQILSQQLLLISLINCIYSPSIAKVVVCWLAITAVYVFIRSSSIQLSSFSSSFAVVSSQFKCICVVICSSCSVRHCTVRHCRVLFCFCVFLFYSHTRWQHKTNPDQWETTILREWQPHWINHTISFGFAFSQCKQ